MKVPKHKKSPPSIRTRVHRRQALGVWRAPLLNICGVRLDVVPQMDGRYSFKSTPKGRYFYEELFHGRNTLGGSPLPAERQTLLEKTFFTSVFQQDSNLSPL